MPYIQWRNSGLVFCETGYLSLYSLEDEYKSHTSEEDPTSFSHLGVLSLVGFFLSRSVLLRLSRSQ